MRAVSSRYPLMIMTSSNTRIEYKWGSSMWMAVCSTIPYCACIYILWHSIPVPIAIDETSQKALDRKRRTTAYFSDVNATTYLKESRPQDSVSSMFNSQIRIGGWTTNVKTVP